MRAAILYDNFGPYHLARLRAASQVCTLLGIQVHQRSRDYYWESCQAEEAFWQVTLEPAPPRAGDKRHLVRRLNSILEEFGADCVFIPGWSDHFSLAALRWCHRKKVPVVIMSESTEHDLARVRAKEWIKSQMVKMCSAGLVGGTPHVAYLAKLGMVRERIFTGYDVVDNEHFALWARDGRWQAVEVRKRLGLPEKYFLASARFIPSKNLTHLIEQYAIYRRTRERTRAGSPRRGRAWSLVLLGEGVQRSILESMIDGLGLRDVIHLPGFKQYAELPLYYGLASAFVHCSTSEPWGLVVNEAMASGLPVLVSERCGCVADLMRVGQNGFTFDPGDERQLAELLLRVSSHDFPAARFGQVSKEVIQEWGPAHFRDSLQRAANSALGQGLPQSSFRRRLVLECLLRR